MKLYTSAQCRGMDEYTINVLGVPSVTLMERASAHLAEEVRLRLKADGCVSVFAGPGNNGGDGIGAAAILAGEGVSLRVFLVGSPDKMTADTRVMAERLAARGVAIERYIPENEDIENYAFQSDIIIDAIFGVGLHSPLRSPALEAAELINASPARVIAADIPSGVFADTGAVSPGAVKADVTVTFSCFKIGQFCSPGDEYCGLTLTKDIGVTVPQDISDAVRTFAVVGDDEEGNIKLPRRSPSSHKGNYGRDLIIAGSIGYTGAPSLASHAAVRSGAGLVFLGVPAAIYNIEAVKNEEAMVFPLPCDSSGMLAPIAISDIMEKVQRSSAILIGPGLGVPDNDNISSIVTAVITHSFAPVIIDADGITAVSRNIDILKSASSTVILTPHDGEFARLSDGLSRAGRLSAAREFAEKYGVILVLKGHRTITAFPDGSAYINCTGNPGMATGGSGDVLAGMILSLVGQGLDIRRAVTAAVYLHGQAGDKCAEEFGEYAMTPTDMIDALKKIMRC